MADPAEASDLTGLMSADEALAGRASPHPPHGDPPMTDLPDRLRRNGEIAGNAGRACNLYFEAADEIDRLRAALDEAWLSEEGAMAILAQIIVERDSERAHADMLAFALAVNGLTSATVKTDALAAHRNRRS